MASQLLKKLANNKNILEFDRFKSILITQTCGARGKPRLRDYCFPNQDPNYLQKGKIVKKIRLQFSDAN